MTIFPRGLTGRTILVLLAAVSLVHAGSMLIYERALTRIAEPQSESDARQRLEAARNVLAEQPRAARPATAALLSSDNFHVTWVPSETGLIETIVDPRVDRLEPEGVVRINDGTLIRYRLHADTHQGHESHASLLSTTVMVGGVIVIAVLLVRGIVAPCDASLAPRTPSGIRPNMHPSLNRGRTRFVRWPEPSTRCSSGLPA